MPLSQLREPVRRHLADPRDPPGAGFNTALSVCTMKLILSRKGFDSAAGGVASPILPDGRLVSLPIPGGPYAGCLRYGDLAPAGLPLAALVRGLTHGRLGPAAPAHLDPDLDPTTLPRAAGWRPLFGQAGAAERHLQRKGVGCGDLFLFLGWFRRVERHAGAWRYVPGAPDLHVIWGWLQVAERLSSADRDSLPAWALAHPHAARPEPREPDSLYVAAPRLVLPGLTASCPGAGVLPHVHPALQLTAPGSSRSVWRLPGWMSPHGRRSCLSYHSDPQRWKREGQWVRLHSAGRGQEFVLDCDDYPEALPWLTSLFQAALPAAS